MINSLQQFNTLLGFCFLNTMSKISLKLNWLIIFFFSLPIHKHAFNHFISWLSMLLIRKS